MKKRILTFVLAFVMSLGLMPPVSVAAGATFAEVVAYAVPAEGGTVTGDIGMFELGSRIRLTATPNEGWRLVDWRGSSGNGRWSVQEEFNFTLVREEGFVVRANFERIDGAVAQPTPTPTPQPTPTPMPQQPIQLEAGRLYLERDIFGTVTEQNGLRIFPAEGSFVMMRSPSGSGAAYTGVPHTFHSGFTLGCNQFTIHGQAHASIVYDITGLGVTWLRGIITDGGGFWPEEGTVRIYNHDTGERLIGGTSFHGGRQHSVGLAFAPVPPHVQRLRITMTSSRHTWLFGFAEPYFEIGEMQPEHPYYGTEVPRQEMGQQQQQTQPLGQPSAWAAETINRVAHHFDQFLYGPYTQPITRTEFANMVVWPIAELAGGQRMHFNDTDDEFIGYAAQLGIVTGVGGGNFNPHGLLTRQEAAVILSRYGNFLIPPLNPASPPPTFADRTAIAPWAMDAVGQMQAAGIIGGVGNNNFDPTGTLTREQAIIMLLRLRGE